MKLLHTVRVPLLTLVLLTVLMLSSSAFAATPVPQKVVTKATTSNVFSSYGAAGGGCMYDHMQQASTVDPED